MSGLLYYPVLLNILQQDKGWAAKTICWITAMEVCRRASAAAVDRIQITVCLHSSLWGHIGVTFLTSAAEL